MCSFEIPDKLYGIQMDITINVQPREYFMEYIETLPHIKKFNYEDKSVWYIFEFSGFTRTLFTKFLEKQIGSKVRNNPWRSCLVSTYHNGPIIRKDHKKPVYGEYTYVPYVPYSVFPDKRSDTVTLSAQQLYNLTN